MKVRTHASFWRRILRTAGFRAFHLAENNGDCDSLRNGEAWLIRQVARPFSHKSQPEPLVVFDVGANIGDYTRLVVQEATAAACLARLHIFEPSSRNAEILRQTFGKDPAVEITCAAVGENPGKAVLYTEVSGSTQASLIRRKTFSHPVPKEVIVPVIRLDHYMATHDVGHIDLLKLDIEGSEMSALLSLGGQLHPDVVRLIQFEYGGATLDAGTKLKDFYDLLSGKGYVIAKLFPNALEIRPYQAWLDHYAYANYVALPSDEFLENGRQK